MSSSVSVPMHVEFNRPFVDLEFPRPDGTKRTACTWVDTGGGAFIVTEKLTRELGLEFGEAEKAYAPLLQEPDAYLSGMRLEVSEAYPCVQINSAWVQEGFPAEALYPWQSVEQLSRHL